MSKLKNKQTIMLKDMNFEILLKNLNKHNFLFDLDLVLEGGCMNGAYEIGGLMLIKEMEKLKYFKIKRISGASVGGYAGFLYLLIPIARIKRSVLAASPSKMTSTFAGNDSVLFLFRTTAEILFIPSDN